MAMVDRLLDRDYVNWLKASQALLYTAGGIRHFCERSIKQYQLDLHRKYPRNACDNNCQVTNAACAVCAVRHAVWKNDILSQFNPSSTPCWVNSDKTQWETDAWEIAKVFMSPGQQTNAGAAATDINGLLQLVLNCKYFNNSVSVRTSFKDVKGIRNKIFHSVDFKLTNDELKAYIAAMKKLLENPKQLRADPNAKEAMRELCKLEAVRPEIVGAHVVKNELLIWKTKLDALSDDRSLTKDDLNKIITFIREQSDLNIPFQDQIAMLTSRLASVEQRTTDTEQRQAKLREEHDTIAERVSKVEDNVLLSRKPTKEQLLEIKEEIKNASIRTIMKYLKNKQFFEDITVNSLDDIYVELRLHDRGQYNRQESRSDINTLQLKKDIADCRRINIEELISPDPQRDQAALKVLITGTAGAGKTMQAMWLLNMWINGCLPAIENIFFYSMSHLAGVRECSLADLLFLHQNVSRPIDNDVVKFVEQMSQKTLVVFDGLHVFGNLSETEAFDCKKKVPMSRLIGSILCGHTLKEVTLLVTSRPGGVHEYDNFDRIAEIYGFTEPKIFEYVHAFYQGAFVLESYIRDCIGNNDNVRSLCHMPVFCNMVCRLGNFGVSPDSEAPFPLSLTRVVAMCLHSFIKEQHPRFTGREYREDVIAEVRNELLIHSRIAKEGMMHQTVKVSFPKSDVESQLPPETAIQCGFLNVSERGAEEQSYRFVHLLMQEFFAAIALLLSQEETETLLEQTSNEGQLDMVLAFLAGLVGDKENKRFVESLGCRSTIASRDLISLVVRQERKQRRRNRKASILLLLMFVFESRQPYLWTEIKHFVLEDSNEVDLSDTTIRAVELEALAFAIRRCSDVSIVELDHQ